MARSTTIVLQYPSAAELQWQAFGEHADVREKVLWIEGHARAAVLHLEPGASVRPHAHRRAAHHVWVVSGSCVLGGRHAQSGCYVFVPPGVEHDARADIQGCTLFYLFLPASSTEGGDTDGDSGSGAPSGDDVHAQDADRRGRAPDEG